MYAILSTKISAKIQLLQKAAEMGVRTLYSVSALGVDNYLRTREKLKSQFHDMETSFKQKMIDFSQPSSNSMIFTEDLKHMVHLVEGNKEDLDLIEAMLFKFCRQNKELRFGSFVFGPVVMRMYHYLNKPNEALQMFKNPELGAFFDQLISFQILMDLLFRNEMYLEILNVFDIIKEKQLQGSKYPKNAVVLVFGACYKINNQEALEYTKKLWSELNAVGHYPMRRAGTFAAALCIAQNAPHIALEILTAMRQQTYVTIRNLKVAALSDLGRPEDTFPILKAVLEVDDAFDRKHTFSAEVLKKVEESVKKSDKKELISEFERIEKQLQSLGHISNVPLSEQLCAEINVSAQPLTRDQKVLATSFQPRKSFPSYQRPGLQDMV